MRNRFIIALAAALCASPLPTQAQVQVSAIDVYMACHSAATPVEKLRAFCKDLRVPLTVRDLTGLEQSAWADIPDQQTIRTAAEGVAKAHAEIARIVTDFNQVQFTTDSATLTKTEVEKVKTLSAKIAANRDISVDLTGLASATGDKRANKGLSERRAAYVEALLLENGVFAAQITPPVGEGEKRSSALMGGLKRNPDTSFQRVDIKLHTAGAAVIAPSVILPPGRVTGGLTTASLLNGLTDYLIAEALREAEAEAMKRSIAKLCGNAALAGYITTSCTAFSADRIGDYMPSISRLRGAIRADLARMPIKLAAQVSRDGSRTGPECVLRFSAEMYVALSEGQTPRNALMDAASSTATNCETGVRATLDQAMYVATRLEEAATDLPNARPFGAISRDTVVTYVIKALAVNTPKAERIGILTRASRFVAAVRNTEAQWEMIVKEIGAARADSAKGGNGARLNALLSAGYPMLQELIAAPGNPAADTYKRIAEDMRRATASLAIGQYGDALAAMSAAARDAGFDKKLPAGTLAFAADLAQAGSSEEVTGVLKRYAGSEKGALQKRNGGARYIMVNGYGGLALGRETVAGLNAGLGSLYFPVGIERGWRVGKPEDTKRPLSSFGILFQIIDLGALAAVRIGGTDSLDRTPPPTFASVWAPGAMMRFGIADTRFIGGFGFEYLPVARREDITGQFKDGTRLIATLAVDIPLFGFK